jgi:ABC-2 type transport system ATP-binding protein
MLEVNGLTKNFGRLRAVDDVNFSIQRGEVVGYLGPNGSGKSTTVKMLTGLISPTRGQVMINGKNIQACLRKYKRRLGYVPEEPYVYPYLSGREYLELVGGLRSIPRDILARKIDHLLELFSLHAYRYAAISSYSKGMKQKVLIAAALLHNPEILIFDEPLSGLDVTTALIFRNLVKSLAREGRMILYSSHVLESVEKACSSVIILHKGRMVANDSVERLRDLMKLPSLEEIFAQLVAQEDTERVANDILDVMRQ